MISIDILHSLKWNFVLPVFVISWAINIAQGKGFPYSMIKWERLRKPPFTCPLCLCFWCSFAYVVLFYWTTMRTIYVLDIFIVTLIVDITLLVRGYYQMLIGTIMNLFSALQLFANSFIQRLQRKMQQPQIIKSSVPTQQPQK